MDWREKLEDSFDKAEKALKEFFADLIAADDRPPNWKVFGGPVKEKRWRRVDENDEQT